MMNGDGRRGGHEAAGGHHRLDDARRSAATPKVIDQSRRRRIAGGAGVEPHEVNELVKQFDAMAEMMKAMAGMGMRRADAGHAGHCRRAACSTPARKMPKHKGDTGKRLTPQGAGRAEEEAREGAPRRRSAKGKKDRDGGGIGDCQHLRLEISNRRS